MRCEDCRQPVHGEPDELGAMRAGLTLCSECIASMEAERDAYAQVMRDEGYAGVFDWERGFRAVTVTADRPPRARDGEGG